MRGTYINFNSTANSVQLYKVEYKKKNMHRLKSTFFGILVTGMSGVQACIKL